jgi:hypothetical protein
MSMALRIAGVCIPLSTPVIVAVYADLLDRLLGDHISRAEFVVMLAVSASDGLVAGILLRW